MLTTCARLSLLLAATLAVSCQGGFAPRDAATDGDVEASACDGVGCSGHGRCEEGPDGARCVCEPGYRAEGLACLPEAGDGDADGDTEPDAETDAETDAEPCPDEDGDGVCDADDLCPGLDDATAGQIPDSDFENPLVWQREGNAQVTAGAGVFVAESCSDPEEGRLRQDICLPMPEAGWPALRALVRASSIGVMQRAELTVRVDSDRSRHTLGSADSDTETELTFCLGERVFRGVVELEVAASLGTVLWSCSTEVAFDRLWLEPVAPGGCPRPGEVVNGGFDPEIGGWSPASSIHTEASGNSVARLTEPAGSTTGNFAITGRIGTPLASTLPSAALQLRVRGRLGGTGRFQVVLSFEGDRVVLWETADLMSDWALVERCLPAVTLGRAGTIALGFNNNDPDRTESLEAFVDDLEIVSRPTLCPP